MQAKDILAEMINRRYITMRKASQLFGKSPNYVSRMINNVDPKCSTIASHGKVLGFTLILHDKLNDEDIVIDPPEE